MAYRDDVDVLAQHRARDDEQAALLASFRRGERARRRRAIAAWFAGLAVTGAIYGGSLAGPMPPHRARHVMPLPQALVLHVAVECQYVAAMQRAHVRQAMEHYLTALDEATVPSAVNVFDPGAALAQGMR